MDARFHLVAICRAATVERMRGEMFRCAARADLLEVRLDSLDPAERENLRWCFQAAPRPTIATARRREDGGEWRGTEADRLTALVEAAHAGAAWIDMEWKSEALRLLDQAHGAGRIVSFHGSGEGEHEPRALLASMARAGGDALKLALTCRRPREILDLAQACGDVASRGARIAAVPVGPYATWGRLWAPAWGSRAGYFLPPHGESEVRPDADPTGALPIDEALDLYRVDRVGPGTPLYGVVGKGVSESLSPRIHMAALRKAGLEGLYVPVEADGDDLEDLLNRAATYPFQGLSVTAPHKEAAARLATRLEGEAAEAGALNTLRRDEDGSTSGFNTDGAAVVELAADRLHLDGAYAVVLGAGGAARGVVRSLVQEGVHVLVLNRGEEGARRLADDLGCDWDLLPEGQAEVAHADLLVNATPLGTEGGPGGPGVNPVSAEVLRGGSGVVIDLVYRPRNTRLLREAARAGWDVVDGTEVLVGQAARQFMIWTGRVPDIAAMRAAL